MLSTLSSNGTHTYDPPSQRQSDVAEYTNGPYAMDLQTERVTALLCIPAQGR